jgi:preprotein translocase subunit SecY
MLSAFLNAFKIPDLRKKLVFTLLMILVYRGGS